MSADEHVVSCPADGRPAPAIDGVERDGQEWHVSPGSHQELLVDITGIEPSGNLELQDLATMTARLEGYVERERRRQTQSRQDTSRSTAPSPDDGALSWFVNRLNDFRRWLLPGSGRTRSEPDDSRAVARPEYAVETVYHLSRVFRTATEARRREVEARIVDQRDETFAD